MCSVIPPTVGKSKRTVAGSCRLNCSCSTFRSSTEPRESRPATVSGSAGSGLNPNTSCANDSTSGPMLSICADAVPSTGAGDAGGGALAPAASSQAGGGDENRRGADAGVTSDISRRVCGWLPEGRRASAPASPQHTRVSERTGTPALVAELQGQWLGGAFQVPSSQCGVGLQQLWLPSPRRPTHPIARSLPGLPCVA